MAILQARPREVEIDLARTAVIVVDMQNAYAKKGGMLDLAGGSGFDEALSRRTCACCPPREPRG